MRTRVRRRRLSEAASQPDTPERRCIVTGAHGTKDELLRFVVGPEGQVAPDLKARLPGRGMWVAISRDALRKAVEKRAFARAAKAQVTVPATLVDDVERLLVKSAQGLLGLTYKAGELSAGFAKVEAGIGKGRVIALVEASDAGPHGAAKLTRAAMAAGIPIVRALDSAELGLALGRENMVHAGLNEGRLARRFLEDVRRLQQFRGSEDAFAGCGARHAGDQAGDLAPRSEELE